MLIWAPNFILRQTGTNCWSHAHMISGYHKYVWMSSLSSDSHSPSDSSKFFSKPHLNPETSRNRKCDQHILQFVTPKLASCDTSAGLPNAYPDQNYGSNDSPPQYEILKVLVDFYFLSFVWRVGSEASLCPATAAAGVKTVQNPTRFCMIFMEIMVLAVCLRQVLDLQQIHFFGSDFL